MIPLRCVVVEDEAEARRNLVDYLSLLPEVEVAGTAADGERAVALVDGTRPDLLLLDVRLPEADAFEVMRRVRHRPEVVFTTAYDGYAVPAFELGALDYLVKPFGPERVAAAVERVRTRLARAAPGEGAVERALDASRLPLARLYARRGDRIVPIAAADVVRASASGDYTEVHVGDERYLLNVSLAELVAHLDPARFERIHRAHVVNLDAVAHFRPVDDRRLLVTLRDGTALIASRAASERIRRRVL